MSVAIPHVAPVPRPEDEDCWGSARQCHSDPSTVSIPSALMTSIGNRRYWTRRPRCHPRRLDRSADHSPHASTARDLPSVDANRSAGTLRVCWLHESVLAEPWGTTGARAAWGERCRTGLARSAYTLFPRPGYPRTPSPPRSTPHPFATGGFVATAPRPTSAPGEPLRSPRQPGLFSPVGASSHRPRSTARSCTWSDGTTSGSPGTAPPRVAARCRLCPRWSNPGGMRGLRSAHGTSTGG